MYLQSEEVKNDDARLESNVHEETWYKSHLKIYMLPLTKGFLCCGIPSSLMTRTSPGLMT
jgi:hypothetical protein